MVYIKQIGISDLDQISSYTLCNFDDKIFIGDIEQKGILLKEILPARTNVFIFILVNQGTLSIGLDFTTHSISKNHFLIILPEHIIQNIEVSNDFKAVFLIIDQQYFGDMEVNKDRLYQRNFLEIRKHPYFGLSEEEASVMHPCLNRIKEKIRQETHRFKNEIIKVLLTEFFLEFENIYAEQIQAKNLGRFSRQEDLLYNFLQLLSKYSKEEHTVVFYAHKLSITTQYLAFILKQQTGKTTHEWIAYSLIMEAKMLLRHSNLSMQQIADKLNFCDASAFGKLFRSQTGSTPLQFRKEYLIPI